MNVILTEKPSQGRNFAKALGGMSGIFNGEPYQIVCARGHLYEFDSPENQVPADQARMYKAWDLANLPWDENLFSWRRVKKSDAAATIQSIVSACRKADEVIVATDNDPTGEGQLIAFEIFIENHIRPKRFSRMWFEDESASSIQKAFKTRTPILDLYRDPDYLKAMYRTQWDFLSMQFTRIATKVGDGRSVLRQGRLKSAMVLLVGDQLKAVKEYKKIPFYTNKFKDENGNIFTCAEEPIYPNKQDVPQKYKPAPVVVDSKTKKSTPPRKLIDLASLSALLSSKGIKAKQVLQTYQKMYEAQIVSYPRTEDKHITPEQFNDLLPKVDAIARVVGVDPKLLTYRKPRTTHVKKGMAHGANRPGPVVPSSLDVLDQYGVGAIDIYVILAKSYLAMLAEDYEYEQQKGHIQGYEPQFVGIANIPVSQGWRQVSYDADDDVDVASMALGTMGVPFIHEGFPPKPQAPTTKWLMKQLEKYDVGTGATRTSIYADVTNEKSNFPLLVEKRGKIDMVKCGDMSYRLLPGTHIGNLVMTERLMNEMKLISQGQLNAKQCLANIQSLVRDDIITMQNNAKIMRKDLNISMSKSNFVQKEKYSGVWRGQPVKFTRVYGAYRFSDAECEALCRDEVIELKNLVSKQGRKYNMKGKLDYCEFNGRQYIGFTRVESY